MAEDDARQRLDLDVGERGALREREAADLLLREADVVDGLRRHGGDARLDLALGEEEAVGFQPSNDSE